MTIYTLFIFYFCVNLCFAVYTKIVLDTLSPYPKGGHDDHLRTYRYVRDCKNVIHGNLTHSTIKTKQPYRTHEMHNIKYNGLKGTSYGHWTIINDPLNMISVLEPLGGCANKATAYVAESAKQMNCHIAINAGFFNPEKPDYGKCLGNIISNGNKVENNNGIQNAVFGIRQDGTIVIGYLSQEEIEDGHNPFIQLINGVGWVLRDGQTYLNESLKAECKEMETTGSLNNFFNVYSARTLIGFDNLGHVHLVQFDGKTHEAGVNLHEAAEYMKKLNITDAINLDGGGSATFVVDSTVINYPTNDCTDEHGHRVLCPKNVSTIICVHNGLSKEPGSTYTVSMQTLAGDSNRNYAIVILLTVIIGILMLLNVFLCNAYLLYRDRVKYLSNSNQKKEALRSLLQEGNSSGPENDDEDEF